MKNLIKKILREETSELTDGQIKAGYALMNIITKGYQWYHDTPEQPFKFGPGSIWLIKPETKEWMFELTENAYLWYHYDIIDTFSMYLNMGESDFESFIKIWMEDVLKRGVVTTNRPLWGYRNAVKDVLERGIVKPLGDENNRRTQLKDVIQKGKQLK